VARVHVLREVRQGDVGEWALCFHWCRYVFDDGAIQFGYRFVWRRDEDGSIQAARGQARIPNYASANQLMAAAAKAGWGDRDGDKLEAAVKRLSEAGCIVDLTSGFVRWPDKQSAETNTLTELIIADARLIAEWTH
jgi:hypothetical protein